MMVLSAKGRGSGLPRKSGVPLVLAQGVTASRGLEFFLKLK